MGLFGRRRVKGISEYEMTRERLHGRLRSAFPYGSSGRRKMAALDAALGVAMDADHNTAHTQRVIQEDEFEAIVTSLEDGKVITPKEAQKLRAIAEKDLND